MNLGQSRRRQTNVSYFNGRGRRTDRATGHATTARSVGRANDYRGINVVTVAVIRYHACYHGRRRAFPFTPIVVESAGWRNNYNNYLRLMVIVV